MGQKIVDNHGLTVSIKKETEKKKKETTVSELWLQGELRCMNAEMFSVIRDPFLAPEIIPFMSDTEERSSSAPGDEHGCHGLRTYWQPMRRPCTPVTQGRNARMRLASSGADAGALPAPPHPAPCAHRDALRPPSRPPPGTAVEATRVAHGSACQYWELVLAGLRGGPGADVWLGQATLLVGSQTPPAPVPVISFQPESTIFSQAQEEGWISKLGEHFPSFLLRQ